jgi:tellurite resistance-related uncharacterized protein
MSSARAQGFRGIAYNPVPNSENEIHGDEVARRHGFRGGLVPGVVVSAYLLDPAVRAYGLDALRRSYADVVVHKPLYDGATYDVRIESQDARGYRAALVDAEGTRCADASFELDKLPAELPVIRHAPRAPRRAERPPATREVLERLQAEGMGSLRARFDADNEMARYHPSLDAQPELLRPAGSNYASFAFLLGMTDWAIARNVKLGPWLHLQTWSHQLAEVPFDSELRVEPRIVELFERKGHEFVDIEVAAFDAEERPVLSARMRCIYKLRAAQEERAVDAPRRAGHAGDMTGVGAELPCASCEMPALPDGVAMYRQTAEFDERTLPEGLRSRHALKAGTWGRIVVLEGRLLYVIEREPQAAFVLTPELPGIVAPEVPHHVEPRGPVRVRIEFHR